MKALFKNKLWLMTLPVVMLFASAYWVHEMGVQGELPRWPLTRVYPKLQWVSTSFTDIKYQLRGTKPAKNPKIAIVDMDEYSVVRVNELGLGRFPWHRDLVARLIDRTFEYGAKYVALDIVFPERDVRVSAEVKSAVEKSGAKVDLAALETDQELARVIEKYKDRLVLGWVPPNTCRPALESAEECPVANVEAIETLPAEFPKFALTTQNVDPQFNHEKTPLLSAPVITSNLPEYEAAARHAGHFFTGADADGVIRRMPLTLMVNGMAYPSLALEMGRLALEDDLRIDLDGSGRISRLGFVKSGRDIATTRMGVMELNARGRRETFPYIKAFSVLFGDQVGEEEGRTLASIKETPENLREKLKDAIVFIGTSAPGAYDMRAYTYDRNVPGVEGHAVTLDNILAGDFMVPSALHAGRWVILGFMVVAALAMAYFAQTLQAIPALILFIATFIVFGAFDVGYLFRMNQDWNTGFFYLEMGTIFMMSIAAKYIVEERNKKFLKSAFAKYVAPAIVDSIVEDPSKLNLGGEKRELTILFSDIRSFTTFSEKMDAKNLAAFLNDYLGIMTDIVFDNGGTLDKYIGDAVMAFWGAPLDQPDHAMRAATAARKMMEALARNQERYRSQYGIDVDIGIGLNSGFVNVGNMGCDKNFEYTVIGDNVNLASRLEGLTKEYCAHILTTRATFDIIGRLGAGVPSHRVLDFVKVKGKKQAVELIEILEREYPADGLARFQDARALYSAQKWDEAIQAFSQAKALMAAAGIEDGPCDLFIERCQDFKTTPPPENWDGAWVMTSK